MRPLVRKYAEIAELTRQACMTDCPQPGACCTPKGCAAAEARAAQLGLRLQAQRHPRLKFMGRTGCVVPPYLRPLCAVQVCEMPRLRESTVSRTYFALREELRALEERLGPARPPGIADLATIPKP